MFPPSPLPLGGWPDQVLMAQRVRIKGKDLPDADLPLRMYYDCNPPSTCLTPSGDCVTTGSQNWSAGTGWCPSGTTMGACQGHPCSPGDARPSCGQTGSSSRSAVCVYGQWACGLGYSLLAR